MFNEAFKRKLIWSIIFFVLYTIVFILLFSTLSYTFPFIAGIILSIWAKPIFDFLCKKLKFSKTISSLVTTLFIYIAFFSMVTFIIYTVTIEIKDLIVSIPSFNLSQYNIDELLSRIKPYYENIDPTFYTKIQQQITTFLTTILNYAEASFKWLLNFALKLPVVFMIVFISLIATFFFTRDLDKLENKFLSPFTTWGKTKIKLLINETNRVLTGYLRVYSLIILITFIETLIGFSIIGVKYKVLLSIIASIFDILPIIGIGVVYFSVIVVYLIVGNTYKAIAVAILYIVVTAVRQVLEPKLVSASLGLHPVAVLAAIYIGLKAFGFIGMIYLIFLMVFYNILNRLGNINIDKL